jgi:phospho-2-dehydro-3-deoxyheptonate aldolase
MPQNENIHIQSETVLITPAELKALMPASAKVNHFIAESRQIISNIVHKQDPRLLVVCGPCSIHDIEAAKEYAEADKIKVVAAAEAEATSKKLQGQGFKIWSPKFLY